MASEVGICNRALQRLGASRIASLDDGSKGARACSAAYEAVRDALLRSYPWSFAIRRASLAADATVPAFEFARAFPFPAGTVRILPPNDHDLDWTIEGRSILTNDRAPLEIRYIKQVSDPNEMDGLFREALGALLAYELCEEITGSTTKQDAARRAFVDLIREARRVNAIEKIADVPPESSWITARL